MAQMTRREFIRRLTALGAAAAGATVLGSAAGCAPQPGPAEPPPAPLVGATPTDPATVAPPIAAPKTAATPTLVASRAATIATPVPAGVAYLAVARGPSPAALVEAALGAIGGIARFVKPGQNVIIKPNICNASHGFEYASTTNPEVVAALVTLCLGAGARRVKVMDSPFSGTPEAAYRVSGIADAVQAAGGEMEVMASFKFEEVELPLGLDLRRLSIYQEALDADVLINVPIAKHHSMAGLTLGMKNLMGLITNRPIIHANFGQRLPDLASLLAPDLTVIDAVRILVDHGPTGGNLDDVRLTNTVIASHDLVAADAYATSLFGLAPEQIAHIVGGAKMGLGTMDLRAVEVAELAV
jgi:uncharacterized protein (DUF362 family)